MSIIIKNTIFTGKFLLHLKEIDSTNNYAHDWLSNNEPIEGTVIIADNQTAGRGQFGNQWLTNNGENLTFSLIYSPKFLTATKQYYLNMAIAIGVANGLKTILPTSNISIKWPNDIYVDNKKIAGILIENTISGIYLKTSIIGIGINVLQQSFDKALKNPTSVWLEGHKEIELSVVMNAVLSNIESFYIQLRSGHFSAILTKYNASLFQKDIKANYVILKDADQNKRQGKIIGVSIDGRLNIAFEDEIQSFYFKEIEYVL